MADELSGSRVAHEVALVAGLAPFSFRVPMPSLNVQFRVLPVTDRLPASRENPLDHWFGEDFVGGGERNAINPGAKRLGRAECIRDVAGGDIDANGLCPRAWHAPQENQDRKSTRLNSSHITISYATLFPYTTLFRS